ncbi:MAG: peptide deformylase [Alphaproteobacteria bacterium]|nr:peptide deformylase [Alphaproteobacteria bacterium]
MAVLQIARMGHPVLVRGAEPVVDPCAPAVRRLVADMVDTLGQEQGVGLAAPQVFVPLRVVIFFVPAGRGGEAVPLTTLVNPVIEPLSDDREDAFEGCLSLPGLMGLVGRYLHIRYRGFGLDGKLIEREAHDFHARVVQHECDHLDGILYPMRMADLTTLGFTDEIRARFAARRHDDEDKEAPAA